jgi:adenylate cyclase class IV
MLAQVTNDYGGISLGNKSIGKPVARNIEIKAHSTDFEEQAQIAAGIADGLPALIEQTDTFFHVPRGRLKLREFGNGTGELIQYTRADSSGPRQSTYVRSPTHEPQSLKEALTTALGVRAIVKKRRMLFMVGQTRIHLDEVMELGRFIELEVVLRPEQTEEEGVIVAERLMSELGVQQADLVAEAYVDLLARGMRKNSVEPTR